MPRLRAGFFGLRPQNDTIKRIAYFAFTFVYLISLFLPATSALAYDVTNTQTTTSDFETGATQTNVTVANDEVTLRSIDAILENSGGGTWTYRKNFTITNNSGGTINANTPVTVNLDTKTIYDTGANYLQADCDDLRVVYGTSSTWTELARSISFSSSGLTCQTDNTASVTFNLQSALTDGSSDANYFYYFGNSSAAVPTTKTPLSAYNVGSANALFVAPLNGTTTAIAAGSGTPTTATGALRYSTKSAMSFDGKNDYVTPTGTVNINQANLTIEFWYKPDQFYSGGRGLFDENTGGWVSQKIRFSVGNTGIPTFVLMVNGSQKTINGVSGLSANTWHHVAGVYDGNQVFLYIDGTSVGTPQSASGNVSALTSALELMRQTDGTFNSGLIDELRISSTARYTSNFTPQTSPFVRDANTKLLLHFDENGDDPRNTGKAIDDSGNGNHGTITGAKYVAGLVGVDSGSVAGMTQGALPNNSYASHSGLFIEEGTINKITNPSFENAVYNTNWGTSSFNYAGASSTFTPSMAKRNSAGPFASGVAVQGHGDITTTADTLYFNRGSQISNYFYTSFDNHQGSIVAWVTPEKLTTTQVIFGDAQLYLYMTPTSLVFHTHYGVSSELVKSVSWSPGTTYCIVARWDMKNKIDGTNYASLSVDNAHTFGTTSPGTAGGIANKYVGVSWGGVAAASSIIEGLTIYRRPLYEATTPSGINVGNGDEISQIYAAGAGKDPTLITGSWDVVFALPTNATVGALTTGTGNAWSHPHSSNLLGGTNGAYGYMMNGTYTDDGFAGEVGDTQTLVLQPDGTTGQDAYLSNASRTYNDGGSTRILSGASQGPAIIRFDLSTVPSGAVCTGATLATTLYSSSGTAYTATIYPILVGNADWIEGTKNNAQAGAGEPCWDALAADGSGGVTTAWAGSAGLGTPGVDYGYSMGSWSGNGSSDPVGTVYTAALTPSEVQKWFPSTNANYGMKLTPSATPGLIASSENTTAAYRPKLTVEYTAPPTVTALDASEKVFAGGYKWTNAAANQGIYRDITTTAGQDLVIRGLAHSDGTSIPKLILYDQTNGAEIGSLTGTVASTRTAPDTFIFTGEAPAQAAARGQVNFTGIPTDGETVEINSITYTFKDDISAPGAGEVLIDIGADAATTGGNLSAAIDGDAGEGTTYAYGSGAGADANVTASGTSVVLLTAAAVGAAGNAYTLTESATNVAVVPTSGTFYGGVDNNCTTVRVKLINTEASGTVYWHQVEVQTNLVNNPSFATGAGDPWIPTGWVNASLPLGKGLQETTIVHSGSSSFRNNDTGHAHGIYTGTIASVGKFMSRGVWAYNVAGTGSTITRSAAAAFQFQSASGSDINTFTGATWENYPSVLRITNGNPAISVQINGGAGTNDFYTDDVYEFLLTDVSLTVTPASSANSTETSGLRVDGRDTLSQPITNLTATNGVVKFKYTPRHNAADMLKFGVATPYIIDLYGNATNYIRVYWSAANTVTMAFNDGTTERVKSWDATGAIVAGTTYSMEINYSTTKMELKVDGVSKIDFTHVDNWWTAGGATGAMVAYQPAGAASYESSKVNLANPGTYDATEGTAPLWTADRGWYAYNGSVNGSLSCAYAPADSNLTYLVRYSGFTGAWTNLFYRIESGKYVGARGHSTQYWRLYNGGVYQISPPVPTTATIGIGGSRAYNNGLDIGAVSGSSWSGGTGSLQAVVFDRELNVAAEVIYNTTLTAAQVSAVTGAMGMVTPLSFSTTPTTAYFGSKQDGTGQGDATIAAFTTATPTENSTAPYYKFGSKSLKLVNSGTVADEYVTNITGTAATHMLSAYVYDGTAGNVGGIVSSSIASLWFNGSTISTTYTDMGGGWWRLTGSLTSTATSLPYGLQVASGKTIYVDGAQLEAKSYTTTYADGSLGSGYAWSGTENESTSTRTAEALRYSSTNNIDYSKGTISLWFKPFGLTGLRQKLVGFAGNNHLSFNRDNNSIAFEMANGGCTKSSLTLTQDKWYHVTVAWNQGGGCSIFVNNSQSNSVNGTMESPSVFHIGYEINGYMTGYADATISDLRIFDSALSSTEVTDLYRSGLAAHADSTSNQAPGYYSDGSLISATIDKTNQTDLTNITWTRTLPANTDLKFQMAGSDTDDFSGVTYVGPDGTASTYYTTNTGGEAIPSALQNKRYFRYKAILASTVDFMNTPVLSDLTLSYIPSTPPIATTFADSTKTTSSIIWQWDDTGASDSRVVGYQVQSSSGVSISGNLDRTAVASGNWLGCSAGVCSWRETGLSINTQYARKVVNLNGDLAGIIGDGTLVAGTASSTVTKYTLAAEPTVTGITGNYRDDRGYSIDLTVATNSNPTTVEYAITPDDGVNYLTSTGTLAVSETWATPSAWLHKDLNAGEGYTYKVKARNSDHTETALSAASSVINAASTYPSNITHGVLSDTSAAINWTAIVGSTDVEISYGVSVDASDDQVTETASTGTKTFLGLATGTTYYYKLRSLDAAGKYGEWSAIGSFITTGMAIGYDTSSLDKYSDTKITPTWDVAVGSVVSYHLEQASTSSYADAVEIYNGTNRTYTSNNLTPNTIYYYRLRTEFTGSVFSDYSNSSQITLPATPKDLVITPAYDPTNSDGYTMTLTWKHGTASTGDATYFKIFVGGDRGNGGNLVGTVDGNTDNPSIKFVKLSPATKYTYYVYGYGKTNLYSPTYVSKEGTTIASKVENLTVDDITESSISLTWDTLSTATGYKVYDFNNNLIATVNGPTHGSAPTGLAPNTSYTYYVRGYDQYGEGEASDTVTAVTLSPKAGDISIRANLETDKYYSAPYLSFTNETGFGSGKVGKFLYSVGADPRVRPSSSSTWSDGTLSILVTTGTYYLFLDVYNSADARFSNAADYQLTFGPFKIDLTPPSNVYLTYPVSDSTSGTHLSISQLPIRGIGGVDVLNSSTVRIFIDGRHTTSVEMASDDNYSDKPWETGTVVLGYGAHTIQAYAVDSLNNQTDNSRLLDFYIDQPAIIDEALPDGTLTGVVNTNLTNTANQITGVANSIGYLGKGLQDTIINSEVGVGIGYLAKGIEDTLGPNPGYYFQKGLALTFGESSLALSNFTLPIFNINLGINLPLPRLAINLSYLQKGFEMQVGEWIPVFTGMTRGIQWAFGWIPCQARDDNRCGDGIRNAQTVATSITSQLGLGWLNGQGQTLIASFAGGSRPAPTGAGTNSADNFVLVGISNIANAITASGQMIAYNLNPAFFGRLKNSSIAFFEHTFDPRATKITNTNVDMVTTTSAVITWQTNHLATSKVNYGLTASYGTGEASDDLTYWHSLTLTGLNSGTKYYFEVMSKNGGYVYDSYHSFETIP